MAFEENGGNGMYMPVAPAYGNGGGIMNGGDGLWIILLLLACGGGWGGMGGWGGGFGNMALGMDFPWILNGQNNLSGQMSDGFRDGILNDGITGIRGSLGDIQAQLCGGFAGVTASVTGAQNAITQQLYANEIASLNRSFAEQTANTAGFNGVQSTLCDIRYGNATNTRDIIENQTRSTQLVLDKLCALELDGYKRENDQLRTQLNMAALNASQVAQTAELRQSGATQLNQLVSELRSCPIPAQPVYGNTPIFSCSGNSGCGCSGATFAN